MQAVILDITGNEATVMTRAGDIIGVRNNGYEIGQEISIPVRTKAAAHRLAGIAAAAAVVMISLGGYTYYSPYGTVSLDVNPSIEYTINRFDRVLNVTGVNDDGDDILSMLGTGNLVHRNIEDAIEDTIGQIEAEGYITDEDGNYVVLTANTERDDHTDTLLANLDNNVKKRKNIKPMSFKVSKDEIDEAHKQGISPGKKMMVDRLESVSGETIDRSEWNERSVREIVNEYDRLMDKEPRHEPPEPPLPEQPERPARPEEAMPQPPQAPGDPNGHPDEMPEGRDI